uniref:histidine kinase n=1 Tax=candidate division WOR-3 bacterium TaxID=2052148 RepID=A0A7C4CBM6_UNCW3
MHLPARPEPLPEELHESNHSRLGLWRPFLLLTAILVVVALAATGLTVAVLFRAALNETAARLQGFAQTYAHLIEEMALHEERFSEYFPQNSEHGPPLAATLKQLRAAQQRSKLAGLTAELILAQARGDSIIFLLHHSQNGVTSGTILPLDTGSAQPLQRALAGYSGTMVGHDYHGKRVVAAFEPVQAFGGLGLVVEIAVAEVRAPFLSSWLIAVGATLALTFLGALLFFRITGPMVRRLAHSEQLHRRTFEQTAVGVSLVAPDGRFLKVNQRYCEITGRTPQELLETTSLDITHPDDRDSHLENVRRLLAGETETYKLDKRYIRKDGSTVWVCVAASLIRDLAGRPQHIIAVVEDITARRQAEDESARLARELHERNIELEQLIYAASHDLRSPLVGVSGFIGELKHSLAKLLALLPRPDASPQLSRDVAALESEIAESLHYIEAGTARATALQTGLLRLSRLSRAAPQFKKVDMNRLIADVLAATEFASRAADATIEVGDLPSCIGDPAQVEQVFANLLDNAIKFRDPVRPLVIRITGTSDGKNATYCVSDTGLGIKPELHQKVLQPFFRVDERRVPGEGLGLAIVVRILSHHHGHISIESEPDVGSRFHVTLPASEQTCRRPT